MRYSVVLHAGAAESWAGDSETVQTTEAFLQSLAATAKEKLSRGETALEVVVELVTALEDYPQFNAGRGSALNVDGFHELEAAVIDGRTSRYRAAGGLQRTRNPIKLAHEMLDLPGAPALIVGSAADELAQKQGLEMVDNAYFTVDSRRRYWEAKMSRFLEDHGTVGAVALDVHGNLAAANSTGGVTFKHRGRIGDTAIVGAGIYADDRVAVVCSGSGDAILQATVAGRAAAAARLEGRLDEAVENAILVSAELFPDSSCGVIAVDRSGSVVIHCNSRIFAVASAGSARSAVQAGITRSSIPILKQLAVFEDEKIRAGMAKYPTILNQIVVHPQPRQPVLCLEGEGFVDFFVRLRELVREVKVFYQTQEVGFVTRGDSTSAFVFPLSGTVTSPSVDAMMPSPTQGGDGYRVAHRDLGDSHRAVFQYLDETLIKVEVYRPEETCLFATELQQYRETIHQISQILQHAARERERGPHPDSSTAPPQLEIHPCRKRRITISWEESRSSTFPQPAPFHPTLLPDHLTTELGPKVSDMAGLERSAREIAKHVGGDNIVI